jgi:multidrug transporter EmrE-like cation transporter
MSTPWFEPNLYAWIPGTLLGVAGGLWGSLSGMLVPRGKGRLLIVGGAAVFLVLSLGLLVAGIVALSKGQPYGIWYGLGFPGLLGTVLFAIFLPMSRTLYVQAEQRKIQARDTEL